jgi:sulfatase maturation enzyme AslB (radical SAM superfamily)
MIDLRNIIDPKSYKVFAGPDWPSLEEIVNNKISPLSHIAKEVAEFIHMQQQNYNAITASGRDLELANQQRQQQQFYDKQYLGSPCRVPWNTLGINANGDAYICSSPSWIPLFVGNILEVEDIFELLNSKKAQRIRQEILAGRYYYCNNKICNFFSNKSPILYNDTGSQEPLLEEFTEATKVRHLPKNLILDFDYTCNLYCGSCRTQTINFNNDHVRRPINFRIVEKIKRLIIDQVDQQPMSIRWCGGELFISAAYLDLLEYISAQNKPTIKHIIQTNGHYLQSRQQLIEQLAPHIQSFWVSFDAATADTYRQVRRGGSWNQLLKNVNWLMNFLESNQFKFSVSAAFVVQLDNYKEIPQFVELCSTFNIKDIQLQKMWNWGTWTQKEFNEKNIYNPQHPLYADLAETFAQAKQTIKY